MSLTATTITPAPNADGGAREFLQHLAATATGVVLPVLAGQHSLTHAQAEQLAVGLVGNGLTYWLPETPTGVQRWTKKALPVVTGVAAALVPLVASGGSLAALAGVAGVVPVLHVLAGLVNVARPNVTVPASPVASPAAVPVDVPAQASAPTAETTAPSAPSSPTSVPVTGATSAVTVTTPDLDPATVTSAIPVVPGGFRFGA